MFADILTNTADSDRTAHVEYSCRGLRCESTYYTDSFMFPKLLFRSYRFDLQICLHPFHPFYMMVLIYFSFFLLLNTFYFLFGSFVLELGEGTLMQWAVALTTLKYSEHVYVGMTVLVMFLLFLTSIT